MNYLFSNFKLSIIITVFGILLAGCGQTTEPTPKPTVAPSFTPAGAAGEAIEATTEPGQLSTEPAAEGDPTEEPAVAAAGQSVELANQLLPRARGLEYGYVDLAGEWIIQPQFEDALEFSEGLASVRVDGLYGYVDETGQVVVEPQFNAAQSFSEGLAAVLTEGQWGYIDQSGEYVIAPQFEFANPFSEGLADVVVNGRIGYIDSGGEMVIEPQSFDFVEPFSEGLAVFGFEGLSGYIDPTGQFVVQPQYTFADNFSEGLAVVEIDGRSGYIDPTGEVMIEPQFDFARSFSEGLAAVMIDNQVGYIDKMGDMVIEPQFTVGFDFSEGLAAVLQDDLWGYIDQSGQMVIEPQFALAGDFQDGLASVAFGEDQTVYIGPDGEVVIEVKPAERVTVETTIDLTPDQVNFDYDPTLAAEMTAETAPGETTLHPDVPYFGLFPEHLVFTFVDSEVLQEASYEQGTIAGQAPQLLVYPAEDYAEVSPFAGDQIEALAEILAGRPESIAFEIPTLPLVNAAQVFHSQVEYLDFQNGGGVRFITQYAQEPRPITNAEIFYTFQGLTDDGRYYVSFFYPVSTSLLPNTAAASEAFEDYDTFVENLGTYMPETIDRLDSLSAENYSPDLALLDAVVESLEIEPEE